MNDWSKDLPELPPPPPASQAVGEPVELGHMVELLSHITPTDRTAWRDVVAGVRATNASTEEDRYDLLLAKVAPEYHAELEQIWNTMPPRTDGQPSVGYG